MLQFDRHFVNGSKFIRGSHSKPPTDFVSRNKRAIRDKSRSQAAVRNATTTTEQRSKGRPRSRTALERQQAERKREVREAKDGGKQAGEGVSSDTVVISKSYLDELLRMSVVIRDEAKEKSVSIDQDIPKGGGTGISSGAKRGRHVDIDVSEVPGLGSASATKHISTSTPSQPQHVRQTAPRPTEHAQNSNTTQQANYQGLTPHAPQHNEHQANNQGLSPHDKWLQELAAQVEEQKAKKERNRLQEQQSTVEEYFPFGRPGGGAPIRSQSGALLTDYRSRTRAQDQRGMSTRGHLETKKAGDTYMHQERAYFGATYNCDSGYVPSQPAANVYTGGVAGNTGVGSGVDVMTMSPRRGEADPQHKDVYNTTPRFARGAGPHVDQYMRREMDEKRRKQMEHMEFVHQQVMEKERVKLEEKLRKEREDALEEAKLAREREKMKADFEREKEKARRKELEARQRQALLQQRILEAEESARLAKLEARGVFVNAANHHPTVSFDEHSTVMRSIDSNYLGEGVYSSLSKSDIRSPSMLQLVNTTMTTNEADHHADGNAPPTQRGGTNAARRGHAIGRSKVAESEGGDRKDIKRRNSRIPVMQQSMASKAETTKSKARAMGSKVQSLKVNGCVRSNKVSSIRGREGGVRQSNTAAAKTAVIGRAVLERSYSPPVPALAKKMKRQQDLPKKDTLQHTQTNIQENVNFIRSSSPPVPAVDKKLRNGQFESEEHLTAYTRTASPPVPTLAKRRRDHGDVETGFVSPPTVMQPSYERTSSPPVPAVAKRLRDEEAIASNNKNHTVSKDAKSERSHDRALSPPVPTVAKKLQQNEISKLATVPAKSQSTMIHSGKSKAIELMNSDLKLEFRPGILAGDSEISINRPPSCKPDSKPLSPIATTTTNLPAIPMAMADHHHDHQRGMVHPPQASNRQKLILQQLTMLKEGILTQQNDIDHRVQNILTRNKECNF